MANAMFYADTSGGGYDDPVATGFAKEALSTSKEGPWFEMDDSGFMDLLYSVFDHHQEENTTTDVQKTAGVHLFGNEQQQQQQQTYDEVSEFKERSTNSCSVASSWELLNNYASKNKLRMMPQEDDVMVLETTNISSEPKLTMEEILRAGGEKFIQYSTNTRVDGISMFIHPYASSNFSGLSMDDARDVELVHLLLSAADKVATQQFDVAKKLISRCLSTASDSGTPIQRVAFYFAEALEDKIDNIESSGEMIISSCNNNVNDMMKKTKKKKMNKKAPEPEKGLALGTNNTFLATHQQLPFIQVTQFAGIQAIIENVTTTSKKKIHLIDLQIRSGIQWTALMQGLADQHQGQDYFLKITAVGTSDQTYMEDTGKRLASFAKSLNNLPFSFKVVYLKDMSEFKEDVLNVEPDETVAVYSYLMLRSMISKPELLENVMRTITRVKPAIMVVTEVEANNNSPLFVDRFIETLFFYSAFFDCLEDCIMEDGGNGEFRRSLESSYSSEGIRNIVADEGDERVTRNVKVDVWRAYFRRFGMREMELSESSKYQASLVLKQFSSSMNKGVVNRKSTSSSCTLEYNGKGLVVGWKGTPFHSLTVWTFT